jgi:hypothetical protein
MRFRIVIYDYVVHGEVSFEGDLASVFNFLDHHSSVVYTTGEINRAVIEGEILKVNESSTATITRIV